MAPVAVGDIIRVDCNFLFAAATIMQNIYHFKVTLNTSADDAAFMAEVRTEIDAWYQIINLDVVSVLAYNNMTGQNITQNEILVAGAWPVLVNGSDIGEALPTQVAACVFFRTSRPKTRGSKFLPPYSEASNLGGGNIAAAALTRMASFGTNVLAGIDQPNVSADYGPYNVEFNRFTPATSAVTPTRLRTQRRRRVGVGI